MHVYLIRHGETDHNRNQILQGHDEIPLNDLGIAQAARLGERMMDLPLDRIISSDLRRAVMTATCVAARTGKSIEYDPAFRERDPGDYTGKTYEEGAPFFLDPDHDPPNGESVPACKARLREAFDAFAARFKDSGEHIALITHGMVCEYFCQIYLDADNIPDARSWGNTSITTLEYNGAWRLVDLANTSHLEEDALPSVVHRTGG